MVHLQADGEWLVKDLGKFVEPEDVYDESGKLLGLFVPANLERGKQLYAELDAKTDWAEVERRAREEKGQGRPLREVFKHLQTLTADPAERAHLQKLIDRMAARDGCPTP